MKSMMESHRDQESSTKIFNRQNYTRVVEPIYKLNDKALKLNRRPT